MKLKISHKLFLANLGITVVLIVAVLSLSYWINRSLVSQIAFDIDKQALNELALELAAEYQDNPSWESYVDNRQAWNAKLAAQLFKTEPFKNMPQKMIFPLGTGEHLNAPPPPPPPVSIGAGPPPHQATGAPFGNDQAFSTFMERVALLDAGKDILIPAEVLTERDLQLPIKVGSATVGWVKMGILDASVDMLSELFFKRQLIVVSWISVIGALLAAAFSYLLSRHFTSPINQLATCAARLARRDFTTRISLTTGDELQELGDSFNQIAKELNGYEARQKQWIQDISHELRTPLTILLGELEAVKDGVLPCDLNTVSSLQEEGLQIKRLVDDLHELSRLEQVGFDCVQLPVQINALLNDQVDRYRHKFDSRNIRVRFDPLHNNPVVIGDHSRLLQVFQNLLENGLRYVESPGQIFIHGYTRGDIVELNFEDSGPGVSAEALPKLFDRLYRTDASRNRKTGGMGLGLAICRNIIESHNGVITTLPSSKGGLRVNIHLKKYSGAEIGKDSSR